MGYLRIPDLSLTTYLDYLLLFPTFSLNKFVLTQKKQFTPKKQWITFKVSEPEMRALEIYCQQTQRSKTNVLRETLRKLPTYAGFSVNS